MVSYPANGRGMRQAVRKSVGRDKILGVAVLVFGMRRFVVLTLDLCKKN